MEEVGLLPNGCMLYRKYDAATDCYEYFSDEIGGGVAVWHTALVDASTLMAAIVAEETRRIKEIHDKEKANARNRD